MRNLVRAGIVIGLVAGAVVATAGEVRAQNIVIAVPATVTITIAGVNDQGDQIVITGQPSGTTAGTGCVTSQGAYPVQDAVVVDPGGNRATRLSGFIVTSQQAALAPGTKITDVNAAGPCTADGIAYNRYSGTVQ